MVTTARSARRTSRGERSTELGGPANGGGGGKGRKVLGKTEFGAPSKDGGMGMTFI